MNHPILTMKMKSGNKIQMELYPEQCPNSINALLWMVEKDGYRDMAIQRIVPEFVIQPWFDEARMSKDYQYLIDGEFKDNGFEGNDLPMHQYAVGLAGDGKTISSPSSFFIVLSDGAKARLQGKFTCIGYVIAGFEEVHRLEHVPLRKVDIGVEGVSVNEPVTPEVIETVRVELNGYIPGTPKQFLPEAYLLKNK